MKLTPEQYEELVDDLAAVLTDLVDLVQEETPLPSRQLNVAVDEAEAVLARVKATWKPEPTPALPSPAALVEPCATPTPEPAPVTFVDRSGRPVQVVPVPNDPAKTRQRAAALLDVAYHEVRLCLTPSAAAGAASL